MGRNADWMNDFMKGFNYGFDVGVSTDEKTISNISIGTKINVGVSLIFETALFAIVFPLNGVDVTSIAHTLKVV